MSQASFVAALVDALAGAGVTRAVLSPGYRSAPLTVAIDAHPAIDAAVIVDERAAAFFALGLARALAAPVILCCTSGSAVANYLPAVVEAAKARIPLVIVSADRPPELQQVGAPQTIAQRGIFGGFVVHEDELAEPAGVDSDLGAADPWGPRIALALAMAQDPGAGGPVHLNVPLRKPLLEAEAGEFARAEADAGAMSRTHAGAPGNAEGIAGPTGGMSRMHAGASDDAEGLAAGADDAEGLAAGASGDAGVIASATGAMSRMHAGASGDAEGLAAGASGDAGVIASATGAMSRGHAGAPGSAAVAPTLARRDVALPQIFSGARRLADDQRAAIERAFAAAERPVIVAGPALRGLAAAEGAALAELAARSGWPLLADVLSPARSAALAHADALVRGAPAELCPDAVLWIGPAPTSAALLRWIGGCAGPVVQGIDDAKWRDPSLRADVVAWAEPAALLGALALPPADPAWGARWRARAAAATAYVDRSCGEPFAWEGPILHLALETWPGDHVHVASSSAIRDVDLLARVRPGARVFASRGANGIDGMIATAAGTAAGLGGPLLAIVGDLAFAHDLGALVHAPAPRLTILVVDNGGGQIFRQLAPLRGRADFERLFVTPVAFDLAALARGAGWEVRAVDAAAGLRQALVDGHERGHVIIHVRVDPLRAARARGEFWAGWARTCADEHAEGRG